MKNPVTLAAIVVVTTISPLMAQRPQFEVASVKLHTSSDPRVFMVAQPGGRFVAGNIPLRLLIRTAFQLQDDQIVGGPGWLRTDRFDIEARAADAPGPPSLQLLEMLKSLLADRFSFTSHTEKRELSVFALERTRAGGSLGPALRVTECPDAAADLSQPRPCANIQTGAGALSMRGAPVHQIVPYLSASLGRVVVDRTGLTERYDFELKWTPEPPPQAGQPPAADPNAVSIFTAVQEQLGLRLSAAKDMVDVLVIDTLERPTPN